MSVLFSNGKPDYFIAMDQFYQDSNLKNMGSIIIKNIGDSMLNILSFIIYFFHYGNVTFIPTFTDQ